jgi:two-component system LytT family sensor kinase
MNLRVLFLVLSLILGNPSMSQDRNSIAQKLKNHPQKDTLRCFWLNEIIEAENNQNVWINYNQELRKIALGKLHREKNNTLRKAYTKYLSISYNNEGAYQLYNESYHEAIRLYKKAFQTAIKIKYHYGSALALQNVGTAFDYMGKIDSTLVYMKQAHRFALLSKNKQGIAYVLTDLGYIYNNLGNNSLAIKYNLQALRFFEEVKDSEGLERTNFALGRIFDNQSDYSTSSIYYLKCLEINRKSNNPERLVLVLNSLAAVYTNTDKIQDALKYNNEAFKLACEMNNTDFIAISHKNYGDIYWKQKQLEKAKSHYSMAAGLFQKINSDINYSKVAIKLATIYYNQNSLLKAEDFGLKGYGLATKTNFPSDQKNAAEILSQIYSKLGNYKKAFQYKAIASSISEKIYFDESKDIALKATYKYETQKKEAAIKTLNQKNQIAQLESKRKTIMLYLVLLLFIAITTTAYVLFSRFNEKKKNEILQNQLQEAEKLLEAEKKVTESELKALKSQMNPHFIFNALNSIQMQFMYGDKLVANEQLNNFTYLTRQILEVSGKKQISIACETEILTKYLELEQLRFSKDFSYAISISDNIDEDYHKIPPMLIQPIVENSLKHGLMHKKGTKNIKILFEIDKEETVITCTIIDNGIGREKAAEIKAKNNSGHKSFSTQSIVQRLELLNTRHNLKDLLEYQDITNRENEVTGTKTTIKIPL